MRTRALVVATLLTSGFALGCGGGGSGPSPSPSGGSTGGGGDGAAGGSGSGGDTSGGGSGASGSGSGGGDQGGGSGASGSGGTSGGSSGSGSGGGSAGGAGDGAIRSSDGSVVLERLDAEPECDGLVPACAPDAVNAAADGAACGAGLSEGGGHVAVVVGAGSNLTQWQAFAPDGRPEERFLTGSPLFPQQDGWEAAMRGPGNARVERRVVAPDGSLRREAFNEVGGDQGIHQWALYEDPRGGTALVFHYRWTAVSQLFCLGGLSLLDAQGGHRDDATLRYCSHLAAAVSRTGETLVLENETAPLGVHWYAPGQNEAVRSSADGYAPGGARLALTPLLDGSVALSEEGRWTRRFGRLAERSGPAPAWLSDRPGWTLRNTRGNRGYALLPPPGAGDCAQVVELRAPSGRLCGKATFAAAGGGCVTRAIDQGWDGTVVQQSPRAPCAWRWWPALLAGD